VFRIHFPTKLSEYFWQGMPVIITGPEYATGLRWGLEHSSACKALVEPELSEMAQLLAHLRGSGEERVRLGFAALEVAKEEFEPVAIRQKFQRFLCEAAEAKTFHPAH
jgi:hypothetical protein